MVDSFERLFHELLALPLQIEHPLAHHDVGAESSDPERADGDRSEHQPVHHSTSTSSCLLAVEHARPLGFSLSWGTPIHVVAVRRIIGAISSTRRDPRMRVLLWHGWLLEGTGSNVYTARVAEGLAADGHDVVLLCQEGRPERYPWVDSGGTVGGEGRSDLTPNGTMGHPGRCILLRPDIGQLLPVFVLDEYEGFDVRRFVDLTDTELERYLSRNVEAVRRAVAWQHADVVITGHAVPGGVVGKRAVGGRNFVTTIHGSDLEYAIRLQPRYRRLAAEGLLAAAAVTGSSRDVITRCAQLVPGVEQLAHVVPPGVDAERFRPRPRDEALLDLAGRLDADPETRRGRPSSLDEDVRRACEARDGGALDALAHAYDQTVPDPAAGARLRTLSMGHPIVGYLGKLIPQKGVALLLGALPRSRHRLSSLIVGFGLERERLTALAFALAAGDEQ